jgi:hypothetical protein
MRQTLKIVVSLIAFITLLTACARPPAQPWQPEQHKKQRINRGY